MLAILKAMLYYQFIRNPPEQRAMDRPLDYPISPVRRHRALALALDALYYLTVAVSAAGCVVVFAFGTLE